MAGMAETAFMNTGVKISGAAHVGLILWAVFGGLFSFDRREPMQFSEVTLVSGEQFAAMLAAGSAAPDVPQNLESPTAPDAPSPDEVAPETPAVDPVPEATETPEPAATEAPEPAPEFDETFETPQAEVTPEAPPAPVSPETPEGAAMELAPDVAPAPRAAPRIAPEAAPAPEPETAVAEEVQQAVRPDESAATETPAEPQEAAAPEEAATRIVPEATEQAGGAQVALAPAGTPRPQSRPRRPQPEPTPAAQPVEQAQPTPPAVETPPEPATEDALAAAVAAAVAEAAPSGGSGAGEAEAGTGTAPTGPPLTSGEKDALRIGVQKCWNIGSLSSEAQRVTVTVFVRMNENATPDTGSIRMLSAEGGNDAAAAIAFEAARRAIIRCGSDGYDLPPEKFGQWREIEMTFNPDQMRIR